jgi:xanthine dehydrogenase accessory factor
VAVALVQAGYRVLIQDLPRPTSLRLTVAFAAATLTGDILIAGIRGVHATNLTQVKEIFEGGEIPVWTGAACELRAHTSLDALVDARLRGLSQTHPDLQDAPRVIALGPGHVAGRHAHFVIETNRGPDLGKVLTRGQASPHTGIPGKVQGLTETRLLRSPADGALKRVLQIGDFVAPGEVVARVADKAVLAQISGMVRGLKLNDVVVKKGHKVGDVDPRRDRSLLTHPSDKASRIGEGVLEALQSQLP